MPRRGRPRPRRLIFWWSEEIARLRSVCVSSLRTYQGAGRKGVPRANLCDEFKVSRKELRLATKKAKEEAWQGLTDSVEADSWGLGYSMVMKKIGFHLTSAEAAGRELEIIEDLFPFPSTPDWADTQV